MLDTLCNRWQITGTWASLLQQKTIVIEPRGSDQLGNTQFLESVFVKDHLIRIQYGSLFLTGTQLLRIRMHWVNFLRPTDYIIILQTPWWKNFTRQWRLITVRTTVRTAHSSWQFAAERKDAVYFVLRSEAMTIDCFQRAKKSAK